MSIKENPYVKDAIFFLATIVISMAGFWILTGRDLVTRAEASTMVDQKTIAMQTKLELYHESLVDHGHEINKTNDKLERILEKNTDAINSLRVQIATLANSLDLIVSNRNP